ncbi:MAG: NADH-quinone oxidoreductase subunit A [Methanocella sp.]|jgi:NADH:ubiquinone oxidoreductase subunit 3 (subunit A)
MTTDIPFILPLVFGVSLAAAVIIYRVGGRISAKGNQSEGKTAAYSCGEQGPTKDVKMDLERFLTYAVYFLIFDILAFVTMTSFYASGFLPVIYSLIVLTAVGMLILVIKKQ